MPNGKCPKCDGPMAEGFVLDRTYGANLQSIWVDGEPEKSFWTGVAVGDRQKIPVTTLRCGRCGYLESFAVEI